MRAIIIDDELKSREVLKILLKDYCDVNVVGEASDVTGGVQIIPQKNPDVVFLDIKLNTDEGFDVLDKLPKGHFEIVFVTSYDSYAIKAIKYRAFDYLLKPIDLGDLSIAIERLRDKLSTKNIIPDSGNDIFVHAGSVVKRIDPNHIQYILADGSYSNIYTADSSYSTSKTLKDIEDLYLKHTKFIRISRGVIVNADFIKVYTKGTYFSITMKDEKIFEVSRRKKAEILRALNT